MKKLYTQSNLDELKKSQKLHKILSFVIFVVFLATLITLILVSTYETRLLFSIITAVLTTVEFYFFLFFIAKLVHFKHLARDFEIIMSEKEKSTIATFLEISSKPITLPDKSSAFEVKISTQKGNKTVYLSSLFDNGKFVTNSRYKFYTAFEYIVGYEDEH